MNKKSILILGDILALAIVTIIGFVTHGESGFDYLPRMSAAFFPLITTWLILAPWFELFSEQIVSDLKTFWRIPLTVIFAAPLALIFRGLILNGPIIPVFAVVFTLTSAFGLIVWRFIYFIFIKRVK